jgi:hypothetical protein
VVATVPDAAGAAEAATRVAPATAGPQEAEVPRSGTPTRGPPTGDVLEGAALGPGTTALDLLQLEGRTIHLPKSDQGADIAPLKLGRKLGAGALGVVYEVEGHPELVVKIIHNAGHGPASIDGQLGGYERIKDNADIAAPRIFATHRGGPNEASYVIMENLNGGRWQGRQVAFSASSGITPEQKAAVRGLYDKLAQAGLIWVDGHFNNVFFFTDAAGRLQAGVLDHDMIVPAAQLPNLPAEAVDAILQTSMGKGVLGILNTAIGTGQVPATDLMNAYFAGRYGAP